ncbi:type III secretion system chaperone family protein [Dongshaea marina]|uniref:hypothetical protein n=1 Tax=Dongshaea marina TaxID=2047966 RepID=UPI000D3E4282|nr:hypothetical protein [Dongshaea marina]
MDLKTQRNLDRFLELLGVSGIRPDEHLELTRGSERLFFEVKQSRLLFSIAMDMDLQSLYRAQRWMLERLPPQRTLGLPTRCYQLGKQLVCSVGIPVEQFNGDKLFSLYQLLSRLLQKSLRSYP